jgi:hypothetical protein
MPSPDEPSTEIPSTDAPSTDEPSRDAMPSREESSRSPDGSPPDLRVGTPERTAACVALAKHLAAKRINSSEYEQRCAACQEARSWAEIVKVFEDLPSPHPKLPSSSDGDDDLSSLGATVAVVLALGLPAAIVLGFVYHAWWTLAVPITVTVAMLYVEHLLTRTPN